MKMRGKRRLVMLRFISKFFLEIFPSVVATVVGAYIVNHYIVPRAGSDAPKAAAYSKAAPAEDQDQGAIDVTPKPEAAPVQDAKSRPVEGKPVEGKPADEAASGKPVEAAKAVPEVKRPNPREKMIVRSAKPAAAETASVTPAAAPEEHRDATELARAAIERLRNSAEPARPAETTAHAQDPAREQTRDPVRVNVAAVPPAQPQPRPDLQPLPPPVIVMAPAAQGAAGTATVGEAPPSYGPPPARSVDVQRPIPPADIPAPSSPLDLQAAAAPAQKTSVADDMLSAARSVIQAVVPQ
jgi:hypothetical protein